MDRSIDVSVIMPLYNKAPYVAEAISSVLEQDYTDFELIICDDGSTDGSQDVVRSFTDPRIRFYQNEKNLGTPGNGNRCFDLCKGKYVIRMDADDVMPGKRISRQVNFLKENPGIAVVSGFNKVIGGDVIRVPIDFSEIINDIFFNCTLSQPASAYNIELLKSAGIRYDEAGPWIGEDWLLFYSIIKKFPVANLPEVFNYYRISDSGISKDRNEKYFLNIRQVIEIILRDNNVVLNERQLNAYLLFRRQFSPFWSKDDLVRNWVELIRKMEESLSDVSFIEKKYFQQRVKIGVGHLFYLIIDDKKQLREYFKTYGVSFKQMRYLISRKTGKLLGRKP